MFLQGASALVLVAPGATEVATVQKLLKFAEEEAPTMPVLLITIISILYILYVYV